MSQPSKIMIYGNRKETTAQKAATKKATAKKPVAKKAAKAVVKHIGLVKNDPYLAAL